MKIIDGHVHFDALDKYDAMMADMDDNQHAQFNVLVIGRDRTDPDCFKQAHALWLKASHPERVYAFGGLDFTGMIDAHHNEPDEPFLDQLERIITIGCDGLKLLSGKPDRRKWIGHPLDGPTFEPMLIRLEQTGFPVLWHVSDPPEFWNPDAVPPWAKKNRWWYDDTHPPREQIEREIFSVFQKYPKLNLVLPHFFFFSNRLGEAAKLLDEHPTYFLDLAPGIEMLHNFTRDREASRAFFIRYQDRIIYGTDAGMARHQTSHKRGWMIQQFLNTDNSFEVPDDPFMTPDDRPPLHGIALPDGVLEKIYHRNFERFVGRDTPKPLNMNAAKRALRNLAKRARTAGEEMPTAQIVLDQWGT